MTNSTNEMIHLSKQVGTCIREGRFPEALPLATRACDLARLQECETDKNQSLSANLAYLGETLRELGRYSEAESACLEALTVTAVLGKESPHYASRLNDLGRLYQAMGKYHQAEVLFHSALNIRLHTLGAHHADYAESLHDLAHLEHLLGRMDAAEIGIRNALAIRTRVLGETHFDVAKCLMTLASIHGERDELTIAHQLAQQAIDIMEAAVGPRHPEFARGQHLKAWIAWRGGNLMEAERHITAALDLRRGALGESHPDFAASLEMLALVELSKGRIAEAEQLAQQSLDSALHALGENHPLLARSKATLATILIESENLVRAEELFGQAAALVKKLLGNAHPDVRQYLVGRARVLMLREKHAEAVPILRDELFALRRDLDGNTSRHADLLQSLALCLVAADNDVEAQPLAEEALRLAHECYPGSPMRSSQQTVLLVGCLQTLAKVHLAQGGLAEAEILLRQALDLCRTEAPLKRSPTYLEVLQILTALYQNARDLRAAEPLSQELLETCRRRFGEDDVRSIDAACKLAEVQQRLGKVAAAETLYTEAVQKEANRCGERSSEYAKTLRLLALLYLQANNLPAAEMRLRQVLEIRRDLRGEGHPDVAQSLDDLGNIYKLARNFPAALQCYQQAMEVWQSTQGEGNPDFAQSLYNVGVAQLGLERFEEAEAHLLQALATFQSVDPKHLTIAHVSHSLAYLHQVRADFGQAETSLLQALEHTRKQHPEQIRFLASLLRDLGCLYFDVGDCVAAEPRFRESLQLGLAIMNPDHGQHALDLQNLAHLYRMLGDHERAEPLARGALEAARLASADTNFQIPAMLNLLAAIHHGAEKFFVADTLYREILEWYRTTLGAANPILAGAHGNLAALYHDMGRIPEAESHYRQAVDVIKKSRGSESLEHAIGLRVLAKFYHANKQFAAAVPLLREHCEVVRRLFPNNHPFVAQSLQSWGELERSQGDFAAAEAHYRQGLEALRKSPEPQPTLRAALTVDLALVCQAQGKLDVAEPLLRQVLRPDDQGWTEFNLNQASAMFALAALCYATRRESEAVTQLERLVDRHRQLLSPILAQGNAKRNSILATQMQEHQEAFLTLVVKHLSDSPEAVSAAFDSVLWRKNVWVDMWAVSRKHLLQKKYAFRRDELARLVYLKRQILTRVSMGSGWEGEVVHQRLLASWQEQCEQLETDLAPHIPELAEFGMKLELNGQYCVSRGAVAAAMPSDTALIEFVLFNDWDGKTTVSRGKSSLPRRYTAFVMHAGQPNGTRMIDLGPAGEINCLVRDFRNQLATTQSPERSEALARVGAALRAAVFDPVESALGDCRRLLVALDGELLSVSLDVLPSVTEGHYLADHYSICYLGTARDLIRPTRRSPEAFAPLVVAHPDSGAELPPNESACRRLSAARIEAEQVARLLDVCSQTSGKACRQLVLTSGSPRILHLAAPSFFRPYTETNNGVGLEGENKTTVDESALSYNPLRRVGLILAASGRTGVAETLTAMDFSGLDLSATELVMITNWDHTSGDGTSWGMSGWRQAILRSGAQSLITNVWPLPEEPRLAFVLDFYSRLRSGNTCSEAMRGAQGQLRSKHPDPAVWGAFIRLGKVEI